ncbi:MAG TPA: GMC family oxidoreductase N-terminal domain-containing protein [Rubrivivax sp.]|nr:GMC family oxidoreductase N-terminal domain-containing protein [Rubrivivax sp.]
MSYDYLIAGGGSAGCVLAARLSEDPAVSVCLVEAGGGSADSVFIRAPLGFAASAPLGLFNWNYETVPQAGFNGRRGWQPRGKVLGGSSAINAMVYTRGNPRDYDQWAALGNTGWGWADVLPLFRAAEHSECFGATDLHGSGGPLNVAWLRSPSPLGEAFLQACEQQGLPRIADYNGPRQHGVAPAQVTQKDGERCGAVRAYLRPALARPNLTVISGATIARVLFDRAGGGSGDAARAGGVELITKQGRQQLQARREVILSAGSYGSPAILMRSGLGPAAQLREHGIEPLRDLPGVGANLQDHATAVLIQRTARTDLTLGFSLRGGAALLGAIGEWRRARTGWVTTNVAEVQGFLSTDGNPDWPDIQLALCTGIVDDHTRKPHWGHGYTLHATLMRPRSRGSVCLASADPQAAPLIDPAFLEQHEDLERLMRGTRMAYDILQAPALAPHRGPMLYPFARDDDRAVEQFVREHTDTEYHPIGTCAMGPDGDAGAVVDAELRVRGVRGLRVVDASVMPRLITGNTNAPTIMIAEKAAHLIRRGARAAAQPAAAEPEAALPAG